MPKKRKKKQNTLLIISLSTLALILVGVLTYQLILNYAELDIYASTKGVASAPEEYVYENSTFTYTKPIGWTDTTTVSNTIDIQSPDYQAGTSTGEVLRGVEIIILGGTKIENQTLEAERSRFSKDANYSDIQDTSIDNLPAIKYHYDEYNPMIHSLEYYVLKDNSFISVIVRSKDLDTEKSYQDEIDTVISSIRFK